METTTTVPTLFNVTCASPTGLGYWPLLLGLFFVIFALVGFVWVTYQDHQRSTRRKKINNPIRRSLEK